MKLSDKITSLQDYLAVEIPNSGSTIGSAFHRSSGGGALMLPTSVMRPLASPAGALVYSPVDRFPEPMWWAHREFMRQHYNIYAPRSGALQSLCDSSMLGVFFPHISRDEPDLIAFTMTPEDGLRDKQTRVAMGRFMRKFILTMTDVEIAKIEARHRSELNPNVKIIPWETDFDACMRAYMRVTSCMGKSMGSFQSDVHPLKSYCAPGWHLAVMFDSDDTATARCIVWINPENAADKRWVRVYGDPSLEAWLKRNDFTETGFQGAYLYTHAIAKLNSSMHGPTKRILAPYLDAGSNVTGGNRPESEKNGYGVWDGDKRIYLIRRTEASKYPRAILVQTTSGYLDATPTPINVPCVISGQKLNALTQRTVDSVYFNGVIGFALIDEYESAGPWRSVAVTHDGSNHSVKVNAATKTFRHSGSTWVDNAETRIACGFQSLSATFYPTEQDWIAGSDLIETSDGMIRPADALVIIEANKHTIKVHKSLIESRYANHVRVASIDDVKTWAHPDVQVVTTTANRKVVPGVHPVTQMYDGTWAYTRHVRAVSLFGVRIYIPKEANATELLGSVALPVPIIASVQSIVDAAPRTDAAVRRVFFKHMSDRGDCYVPQEMDATDVNWTYEFDSSEIKVGVLRRFLALPGDDARITSDSAGPQFHVNGNKLMDLIDKLWAAKTTKAAETAAPADAQIPLAV